MARMLLGVTGGIAAYKALELVRLATKAGHAVRVGGAVTVHPRAGERRGVEPRADRGVRSCRSHHRLGVREVRGVNTDALADELD